MVIFSAIPLKKIHSLKIESHNMIVFYKGFIGNVHNTIHLQHGLFIWTKTYYHKETELYF